MEGVANSVEDRLVDGLSFQLKPGASYVTERKSVTFHPQGSNIYSTSGTKLIKLLLTGDQWLDPSTFRIMFDLQNMDTENNGNKLLRPIGGPHTFFRRMRILANGAIIEDIDNYNRVHEMFKLLKAEDTNVNDEAEAFGQKIDKYTVFNTETIAGIKPTQTQTVLFKPCSGLFNQPKMLPIRYMPITIELEIVHDNTEPVVSNSSPGTDGFDITNNVTGNTSTSWQIQNVQVKVDVVTLDNQLDNSYAEHLLSGKALPINYQTYVSQMQSILSGASGQQKVRLNVTRALSRLKNVFLTLDKSVPSGNINDVVKYKPWNSFYSPMEAYTGSSLNKWDASGEIGDFQIQIGSKLFPEYPIRSHAEAYYQLRKTLGKHDQHNSFNITQHEYRCRKMILGIDMEKVLEAGYTGINTRSGDLMSIRFDHASSLDAEWATQMHVILTSDQILEVRDSGVQVFD